MAMTVFLSGPLRRLCRSPLNVALAYTTVAQPSSSHHNPSTSASQAQQAGSAITWHHQQQGWLSTDRGIPGRAGQGPWALHLQGIRTFSTEPTETPDDPHPFFPRLSQENPVQARFERAEVARAYEGLFIAPWFQLWDGPGEGISSRLRLMTSSVYSWLFRGVLQHVSNIAKQMVQNEVEGAFQREEFLDGAQDAMTAVLQCVGSQDWSTLSQTCSERLVQRWQIALSEMDQGQSVHLSSLDVDKLYNVRLSSINLWTSDNIAKFDESWPKEVDGASSASWLVATVYVSARLLAVYKDPKTDKELPPTPLIRQGAWLFTRGPLPKGFSSQLTLPWRVLAVW